MKKGKLTRIFDPRVEILANLKEEDKHIERLIEETNLSSGTIDKNIRILEKEGLITAEQEDKFPRRRFVSLTDKGRKVAEHLEEIRKILEEV